MIRNAADLTPETKWDETIWSCAREEKLADPFSKPRLCVAALLPFHDMENPIGEALKECWFG
jgi:hypothetical protein